MKQLVFGLVAAFALVGCATTPSEAEQVAADYGAPIDQATAETLAKGYIATRLKDPMSAVYAWDAVAKGYSGAAPIAGRKLTYGYLLTGTVNAKNSFGGYVGATPYQFLFRDGRLVYSARQDCLQPGSCYMAPF
jgi:hypothetical protein